MVTRKGKEFLSSLPSTFFEIQNTKALPFVNKNNRDRGVAPSREEVHPLEGSDWKKKKKSTRRHDLSCCNYAINGS
jgi:hypothetical protein